MYIDSNIKYYYRLYTLYITDLSYIMYNKFPSHSSSCPGLLRTLPAPSVATPVRSPAFPKRRWGQTAKPGVFWSSQRSHCGWL